MFYPLSITANPIVFPAQKSHSYDEKNNGDYYDNNKFSYGFFHKINLL